MGQTLPRLWQSCKKGGRGQKKICVFFCGAHFRVRREANNYFFFAFFFVDNNILCQELNILANL